MVYDRRGYDKRGKKRKAIKEGIIMTEFNDLDETTVMRMKTQELLNYIDMIDDMDLHIKHKIRFGINQKFDLITFINGSIDYKPHRGKIRIRNEVYDESDIWTEIRDRDALMRKEIIKRIKDDDITKMR